MEIVSVQRNCSVTRHPFLVGFALKCGIFKLSGSGVKNSKFKIFDSFILIMSHISIVFILCNASATLTYKVPYVPLVEKA